MEKEKLHIIPHDHAIDRSDRERLLAQKAQLIWFVGLSGSGKSTLASRVEQELHQMGRLTYILDGDNVRTGLNKDLDFSEASRMENIRRIGEVSKLMVDAGLVVITAFISPFRSDRSTIRELVGTDNFVEVHVDCPIEECEKRDVKGLYAKARQGLISNFTGISSPFEAPEQPEVLVQTHLNDIDECTNTIINYLKNQDA